MYKPAINSIKSLVNFIIVIALTFGLASCTSDSSRQVQQNKAEIAILMPLTGPHGEQGKRLAELTRLGIEDHVSGLINITSYDVATSELTANAVNKMMAKKTQVILGPIFTPSVKELTPFVKENDLIMLTLSNNPLVAEENRVFVFGHAPLKQTTRLFGYLFKEQYKDFILILPANRSAGNLQQLLTEMIMGSGSSVIDTILYTDKPESITQAMAKLSGLVDQLNENIDSDKQPVIYLAEENEQLLKEFYTAFRNSNLDSKALIVGDGRLDINSDQPINIVYTGALTDLHRKVAAKIGDTTGNEHLNFMDMLAYDLGSMTASAIGISYNKESFLSRLKSPALFHGLSGDIRFKDAVAERKYNIIKREGLEKILLEGIEPLQASAAE